MYVFTNVEEELQSCLTLILGYGIHGSASALIIFWENSIPSTVLKRRTIAFKSLFDQ